MGLFDKLREWFGGKPKGPAQRAGEKLDQAAAKAGEKVSGVVQKAGEKVTQAGERMKGADK